MTNRRALLALSLCFSFAGCSSHHGSSDGGDEADGGDLSATVSDLGGDLAGNPATDAGFDASPQALTVYATTPASDVIQHGDPNAESQYVDIEYHFAGGPAPADYTVFVHFIDDNGKKMTLNQDFSPPVPTSQWSGGMQSYYRSTRIPLSINGSMTAAGAFSAGVYTIAVGLYQGTNPPIPIATGPGVTDLGGNSYAVGTLVVSSLDGTVVTAAGDTITTPTGHAFTLANHVVSRDGTAVPSSPANAVSLLFINGAVYATDGTSWFVFGTTATFTKVPSGDPRFFSLVGKPAGVVPPGVKSSMMPCVNIHAVTDPSQLMLAQAAGMNCVRIDVRWNEVEQSVGVYNFKTVPSYRYDYFMQQLTMLNMKVLFTLDFGNDLYTPQDGFSYPPITPTAIEGWKNFVSAVASEYKANDASILGYEIWNEENGNFWPPGENPPQYAAVLNAAIEAVEATDPKVPVVSGGLSHTDIGFLQQFLPVSELVAKGAAVGVHPYRENGPETALPELSIMQGILGTFPLWITEWGYTSTWYNQAITTTLDGQADPARIWQARMAVRTLLAEYLAGSPFQIYYELLDGSAIGNESEGNFGLVDSTKAPKHAYTAVQTMTGQIGSDKFAGVVTTPASTLNVLRFDGADTLYVVWLDTFESSATLTLPTNATGVTLLGASAFPTGTTSYTLHESDGPVYIHIP